MTAIDVDGLAFTFPAGWTAGKPDDWAFYRKQFSRIRIGVKSTDALALDATGTTWLIEAKDYSQHACTKPSCLADEVAAKVCDTLSMLLPASVNANDAAEKSLAQKACASKALRVVLHLEQPLKPSRLRPQSIDPAALLMKLKKLLKPVDAHPLVVARARMRGLAWSVV
jgi:hypothetical protein